MSYSKTKEPPPKVTSEIGVLIQKSTTFNLSAPPFVPKKSNAKDDPGYRQLLRLVQTASEQLGQVDKSRSPPLTVLFGGLQREVQALGNQQFTLGDKQQSFTAPLVGLTQRANGLLERIATAIRKGPKVFRAITCTSMPAEALVGTVLTLKDLGPQSVPPLASASLFRLRQGSDVTQQIMLATAGNLDFQVFCAEDEDYLESACPCSVLVKLPLRPIPEPKKVEVEYGTAVTLTMLGFDSDGKDFTLEPADGLVQVGKSPNLRIIAPAVPGRFDANFLDLTYPVRPKARTLSIKAPNLKGRRKTEITRTGTTLQSQWFNPRAEIGEGELSFVAPAEGLLLVTGRVQVQLNIAASGNYAAATSNPVTIEVTTKGTPAISWRPPDVAVIGDAIDPSLNATISPATLQSQLRYEPKGGTTWSKPGCVYIRAHFPGDTNFEAVVAEAKQVVVKNRTEARGATEMLDGTAWRPPSGGTPAYQALDDWNNDVGKAQTLGKQIVKDIANKTLDEITKYLNELDLNALAGQGPQITVRTKTDQSQRIWSFSNGLQVRVKDEGDKHTFACAVDVEMVATKGQFTTHVSQTCFKIMTNGSPGARGPWNQEVRRPRDMSDLDWEDYKSGTCRATHIICPKVPPVINWPLDDTKSLKQRTSVPEQMTVSCLGSGELKFRIDKVEKSAEAFRDFNFPRKGKVDLYVEASATTRYTGLTIKRTVNVE